MSQLNIVEYNAALKLNRKDISFKTHIAAALIKANPKDRAKLKSLYGELCNEVEIRYSQPGGIIPQDKIEYTIKNMKKINAKADECIE